MTLGPFEALVIVAVLLLVIGPTVLPRVMRNVGRNVGAFKRGMKDADVRKEIAGVLERERDEDRAGSEPGRGDDVGGRGE